MAWRQVLVPPPIHCALGAQVRRLDRKIRNSFIEGVTLEIRRVSKMPEVETKVHCPLSRSVWHSMGWGGLSMVLRGLGLSRQLERAVCIKTHRAAGWAWSS